MLAQKTALTARFGLPHTAVGAKPKALNTLQGVNLMNTASNF